MKFVELERPDGELIFIDPESVTIVERSKKHDGECCLYIAAEDMRLVKGTRAEVVAKLEADGLSPITPAFHKVLHEACQDVRELLDHLGITEIPRSLGHSVALFSEYAIETTEMYNRLRAKYPKKEEGEIK